MTDTELIQKFLSGDIDAFNRLVWRWEKPIFNFILKMCCDFEASKDICQKTFIRAYKSLRKLKDHAKFKSWLYQIAVNLCRDEIRKLVPSSVKLLMHTWLPVIPAAMNSLH